MLSSLRYVRKIALYAGILSAVFSMAPGISEAASILSVHVNLTSTDGEMPPSVRQRIEASLASIGNRVLVGKEAEIFQNNRYQYDKVLADIVNRVVVGYVVSDMSLNYGQETTMNVVLMPVGQTIKSVRTEVDYGNLTPLAQTLVISMRPRVVASPSLPNGADMDLAVTMITTSSQQKAVSIKL